MEKIIAAADDGYAVLQNSIVGGDETESSLESAKTSISSARSSGQNELSAVKSEINNLQNLENLEITELRSSDAVRAKTDAVRAAELAAEKAADNLQNLKNSLETKKENKKLERVAAENELTNLQNSLAVAEKELADLQRGETAERIAIAKNDVAQKELNLQKVKKNVEKYELVAPFDGILRKIDFLPGDNLLADDDKFAFLENPDLLEIKILLDQIDVVKIPDSARAEIIFDAHPEKIFAGKIDEIDQTPLEQSGVVSYETTINLNKNDEKIFSGMTAAVTIFLAEKNDVLLAPSLAVVARAGKNFLKKMVDGAPREIEISTGISDGKNIEIISGEIAAGDEIVISNFQKLSPKSANGGGDAMRQMMRATGGFRGR